MLESHHTAGLLTHTHKGVHHNNSSKVGLLQQHCSGRHKMNMHVLVLVLCICLTATFGGGNGLAIGTMTMKHVCLCYADTDWQGPQGQHGSSVEGNAHHPLGTTQTQAPAITEMHHRKSVAQESRTGQGGLYRPSRPTSTHERPREHTATHDRPRQHRRQGQVCLLPVSPAGGYSLHSWQLTILT